MEQPLEIVHVITATEMIDSESYQRTLGMTLVGCLPPGFFVVRWPSAAAELRYDESAQFIGPFESRHNAELMHPADQPEP